MVDREEFKRLLKTMEPNSAFKKAMKMAFDKIVSMDNDKFHEEIEKHKNGDIASILLETGALDIKDKVQPDKKGQIMSKQDEKIIKFLEGKTIKKVIGIYCRGGLEIIFTDGSKIEIDAAEFYKPPSLEYTINGEIINDEI